MASQQAMIIVNPSSGREKAQQYKDDIKEILQQQDYEVSVRETEKAYDALQFAEEASQSKIGLVSVLGGDGTVNEVINGLAEKEYRPMLHIIPLGTVNNFAKALNIPLKPEEASHVLNEMNARPVDVGKINDHYFMNLVNIGAIAEATYQVSADQKSKLGPLAYFIEGVKKFSEHDIFAAEIEHDQQKEAYQVILIIIAVTDTLAGIQHVLSEAEVDDGYLHVYAIKDLTNLESVSMLTQFVNGSLKDQQQVAYWKTKEISVHTTPSKITNIDGDEGESTPIKLSVLKQHINILT
ncbi:diacylglycerol kinase family lipid kinase [Gracilibacillus caseinilyticus]|uniref:Diacylglycerol kinase family lipid kinase n=1 Tax=Gracilibacillus caseinilyticus TaxID=2932256 RepID=A0ABY4ERH4_9BACI|nr:diacylglycerol kinase family protein [Gracilibacillus caseinilyticus]UOQ47033.1 diacylglycerol kinase family lipid kinase [Gracilibacillus caseinilyticus]